MKKMLILMTILIIAVPITAGLLCYKSPAVLPKSTDKQKIIYLETATNKLMECDLEEYLVGVLAAEMPAEYHIEALKAQAVAARSFIISRLDKKNPEHPKSAVCDDPNHCKAHLDEKTAKQKWAKDKQAEYWNKLRNAVDETSGEYMVCGDEVVEAFFFARSSGKTENSEDVWGEARAYLKSVESPYDKSHPEFESGEEFEISDARRRLNKINPDINMGNTLVKIGEITYTTGGSVDVVELDGVSFRGKDIRSIFGLKSASFSVKCIGHKLKFKTFGYGHGVGMSQYGANCMAKNGENYTEILLHYYTNVQIVT